MEYFLSLDATAVEAAARRSANPHRKQASDHWKATSDRREAPAADWERWTDQLDRWRRCSGAGQSGKEI